MKITAWPNKPYPFISDIKHQLLVSFSFGLFIYLFLLIFQPFGIDNIITNKYVYLIGFGLVTILVMVFCFMVLPKLFPKYFDADRWNIGKEIIFIGVIITLISVLNFEYNTIIGAESVYQHTLLYFIPVTLAVGFFPIVILVFLTEIYLSKKHQKTASLLSSEIQKERTTEGRMQSHAILIESDSKKEKIEINERDLLFIKSEDNYCRVTYLEKGEINNQLLRVTLKNIENQLVQFPDIIKCHRSNIVNRKKISRVSGNARAYNLHFEGFKESVSVSRNFPKEKLFQLV